MKRRLTKAYDHMTMPDNCAQRIEQRLQRELEGKKTGTYTKTVAPDSRRNPWAAAVAAVCVVLMLSVGGTALFLHTSTTVMNSPMETTAGTTVPEPSEDVVEDAVPGQNWQESSALFADVLNEKESFSCELSTDFVTITQYCEKRSKDTGKTVTVPCFTLVDMDRDGVKELVLKISIEGDPREDYLILRCGAYSDGGGYVYAFMEPQQMITDLKKDGSFYWRGEGNGLGDTRIVLDGTEIRYMEAFSQTELVPVFWHTWPCARPEVVVQCYEYTGTGQSLMPGNPYYTFAGLVKGTVGNDWNYVREQLTGWGMVCAEEEGTVSVFDPDAPGTCMYGTLTDVNGFEQFSELGFYICTEDREYQAVVRGMLTDSPEYVVDAMRPAEESPVQYPELILDYFGWEMMDSEVILETNRVKAVTQEFARAYFAGDRQKMAARMVSGQADIYSGEGEPVILSWWGLPTEVMAVGDTLPVSLTLREPGQDSFSSFSMELVKGESGWKVLSYGLEK